MQHATHESYSREEAEKVGSDRSFGLVMAGAFAVLFVVILGSALSVVRHADHLAERLGEPYGTLILTLSVTSTAPSQ